MKHFVIMILVCCFLLPTIKVGAEEIGISAKSAIVMDMASGRILYAKNIDEQLPMASTTKIMTAIVALDHGKLEDTVEVSASAAGVEGSSMYLAAGERITLENLLYGLMLVSGNDAATAIAEYIAGSPGEFAELMNQKAKEIGADSSHFDNPHGLPNEAHFSTARDMAKITAYGLSNPKFAEIVSTKTKKVPWEGRNYDRVLNNHNKLLSLYDGCIGVKTGFTKAAGRCLVSAARRNDCTLVCVTLNAPNDWNDHMALYDNAFQTYQPSLVISAGSEYGTVSIKEGTADQVKAIAPSDCYYPTSAGEAFEVIPKLNEMLKAPVRKGDIVGYAKMHMNGEECGRFELVAAEDVLNEKVVLQGLKRSFASNVKYIFRQWISIFGK